MAGVAGITAVTLTANSTPLRRRPTPDVAVEAQGHQQKPAGSALQAPRRQLEGRGDRRLARLAEDAQARAHAHERAAQPADERLQARRERETAARGTSTGASSTIASSASGAERDGEQRAVVAVERGRRWRTSRRRGSPSASRLSSVCETIVPSTTGSVSRARPSRRATISAREGSPRRAGSVADISTPMNVPCIASRRRAGRHVGAALRIACQAKPRANIEAHISPRPAASRPGLEASRLASTPSTPIRDSASSASASPAKRDAHQPASAAKREQTQRAAARLDAGRLESSAGAGRTARQQVGGREAVTHRDAAQPAWRGCPTAIACS